MNTIANEQQRREDCEMQKPETETPQEPLCDFWWRMREEGVDMKHVREMLDRVEMERADATLKAAKLFYPPADAELTMGNIVDQLSALTRRADTLYLAAIGFESDHRGDTFVEAIVHSASEVADDLRRIHEAASAIHTLAQKCLQSGRGAQ